jgi:hypothetical protein
MKNKILLVVFLGINLASISNAQVVATCSGCAINNVTFNLITAATATNPAYYMGQPGPKFHLSRTLDFQGDGLSKWHIVYESPGGYVAGYYKSSPSNTLHPPCNELWENIGSLPKTYVQINFAGNTCIQLPISTVGSGSVTSTVNGVIYPVFTSNQIATIPNPVVGQTVFDFSRGILRTWNGSIWSPL